MEVKL